MPVVAAGPAKVIHLPEVLACRGETIDAQSSRPPSSFRLGIAARFDGSDKTLVTDHLHFPPTRAALRPGVKKVCESPGQAGLVDDSQDLAVRVGAADFVRGRLKPRRDPSVE